MSDEVNDKKKESWRYKEGQRDKEVECLVYEHEVGGVRVSMPQPADVMRAV